MSTTATEKSPIPADLITQAMSFPTATLHEAAGKIGSLPWEIKPVAPQFRLCGRAVTVQSPGGDNLWLHRGIYAASAGDVLVVNVSGVHGHGYWGEIMSTAAKVRGLAGLVIDGCVRDGVLLEQIGFPVFARGLCIRGTAKDFAGRGSVNAATRMGEVSVCPGDLIVGDSDGVVTLPRSRVAEILAAATRRTAEEETIIARLEKGESTLGLYGWDRAY